MTVLLMLGLAVYLITASAAGTWFVKLVGVRAFANVSLRATLD